MLKKLHIILTVHEERLVVNPVNTRDSSNSIVLQYYCKVLQYFGIATSQSSATSIAKSQSIATSVAKSRKYCNKYFKSSKVLQYLLKILRSVAISIAKLQSIPTLCNTIGTTPS